MNDTDGDGLLNRWESSATPILDPNGDPLPNLSGIANPNRKDLFIEMGYFETTGAADLQRRVEAAALAPADARGAEKSRRRLRGGAGDESRFEHRDQRALRSRQRFSSGRGRSLYRSRRPRARRRIDERNDHRLYARTERSALGVPVPRPGHRRLEDRLPVHEGQSDQPLGRTACEACEAAERDGNPATVCERRFDRNRKDMFRYVLFAHALGIPKEACIEDDPLDPNFGFPDETCQEHEPRLPHSRRPIRGVGDFLGGDAIVTLGAFDNAAGQPVGTDYAQAATLMHEVGHGLGLRHGGDSLEPNCKPNYLSVMNYLFQLRGLRDDAGIAHVELLGSEPRRDR